MMFFRRVRLFVRDYRAEFGVAWSLARTRDCERNGGHPWGSVETDEVFGLSRTCARCGALETVDLSNFTATGTAAFYLNATNMTA